MAFTRAICPNCGASNALWEQIEEADSKENTLFAIECEECSIKGGPQIVDGITANEYIDL